ncbi:uncharacterized protein BDW70DRAFT_151856 [Aspergillus foveolatus]|uniref:uncharacterized protein n=1 Tax=Aspergillus foveolatus TaxID=210207 RepID=UPI003CCCA746
MSTTGWTKKGVMGLTNTSRVYLQVSMMVSVNHAADFADTAPTTLDSEGSALSSNEILELAMSKESFSHLTRRYRFSQALDTWKYRSTSGTASRQTEYDENGEVQSVVFILSVRLSGSFASIIAIHHDFATSCAVALGLRVSPYDQSLLQQDSERHKELLGHALLVPTILIEISLSRNMLFMQKIRQELSAVEKATGQHGWLEVPATDAPAHDSELSRLGHTVKLHISLVYRRIDSIGVYLDLIKQTLNDVCIGRDHYVQWIGNLETALKFRLVDTKYNERRADNQITAIYSLLTQRDNMIGVSVAMESKKISEASKRDGSALKSLTVLTAIFFPATYIATLFSLPTFDHTPLWIYWVVVVPLTLVIFGSWSSWTVYRQRRISQETAQRDIHGGIERDPERAYGRLTGSRQAEITSGTVAMSALGPSLRHTRLHTKNT